MEMGNKGKEIGGIYRQVFGDACTMVGECWLCFIGDGRIKGGIYATRWELISTL